MDSASNLFIAASAHHLVRNVSPDGIIATVVGENWKWANMVLAL